MLPAVISVRAGKPASASRLSGASARVGLGIVLVALLTLSTASIVSAHAFLVSTTPRAGERLLGSPSEVVFQFSEPVMVESDGVAVRTAQGAAIPLGPPESNGRSQLRIPLPPLAPAVYSVSWSVVASDGHHSAGEFAFGVGTEAIEASTAVTSDAPIAWPAAAAGAMLLVGFALGAGGLLSELVVWQAVAREQGVAVPRAPLHAGLVLGAVGAASQFMLAVGGLSRLDLVLTTRPAVLAAIELACLAYTAWISWRPRLRAWTVLLLCMGIVAFLLGGHAGGATQWWAMLANAVHVAVALFWVGALAHLLIGLWRVRTAPPRALLAKAASRYATLALLLMPPLLVAGAITALDRFSEPAELVSSGYGRILLVKLGAASVALVLAVAARLRAMRVSPPRLGLLRRLAGAEGLVLLGVLGLARRWRAPLRRARWSWRRPIFSARHRWMDRLSDSAR